MILVLAVLLGIMVIGVVLSAYSLWSLAYDLEVQKALAVGYRALSNSLLRELEQIHKGNGG